MCLLGFDLSFYKIKIFPDREINERSFGHHTPDLDLTEDTQVSHSPASYHYSDVIMGAMASQIISLTIVYSTVYSGVDQRKT